MITLIPGHRIVCCLLIAIPIAWRSRRTNVTGISQSSQLTRQTQSDGTIETENWLWRQGGTASYLNVNQQTTEIPASLIYPRLRFHCAVDTTVGACAPNSRDTICSPPACEQTPRLEKSEPHTISCMCYSHLVQDGKMLKVSPDSREMPMRPVRLFTSLRFLIVAWLITWGTTTPLSHANLADITDGPTSVQDDVAHTLLVHGEFSHASFISHQKPFSHMSNQVTTSPVVGLDLLEDDEDSKHRKVGPPRGFFLLCCLPPTPPLSSSAIDCPRAIPCRFHLFAASQGPRAPPSLISL